jgi:SAM-dependent methyltransferase
LIRNLLPSSIKKRLWGDRKRWGLVPNYNDPCWIEWQKNHSDIYLSTQREGIGTRVNDAGYYVMSNINLRGKRVLEIGGGDIRHLTYWHGKPDEYLLADVSAEMMEFAQKRLVDSGVRYKKLHIKRNQPLPIEDNSVDVIISFYSLEHLYPLPEYLKEMKRVLRPGGSLIGAIPSEGGLAWGSGRYFTSRRWFKKNTSIDLDKLICWEHPNFADYILSELGKSFERRLLQYWPFIYLPIIDFNLILRFHYTKPFDDALDS